MKTFRSGPALILAVLALSLPDGRPADGTPSFSPSAGLPPLPVLGRAPTWKLKDLEGREVSSAQFKDKVIVVDFWATWCGPCRLEIPGYIELQKKYGPDGLVIVGVSLDQAEPAQVRKFVQAQKMNYLVVMGDEETAAAFGATEAIPTTILIDRTGAVRDRKVGAEETAEYERKIRAVLH